MTRSAEKVKIGDFIEFTKFSDLDETVIRQVEGLLLYKNCHSAYEDFFEQDLYGHYSKIEEAVKDTYESRWSKETKKRV